MSKQDVSAVGKGEPVRASSPSPYTPLKTDVGILITSFGAQRTIHMELMRKGLGWVPARAKTKVFLSFEREFVGATVVDNAVVVYALERPKKKYMTRKYTIKMIDAARAADWRDALLRTSRGLFEATDVDDVRRVRVLINPFAGRKKAVEVWEKEAVPLFEAAGVDVDVTFTERAGHAGMQA